MPEKGGTTPPDSRNVIVHRKLFEGKEPDGNAPEVDVARIVAELEDEEPTEISALYDTIDHLVEHLFSNPPPIEAQARLEFTFEGYRIGLVQDGTATFMKISE